MFVGRLTMDDDSSAMAELRDWVAKHNIEKVSDKNHTFKGFKKALWAMNLSKDYVIVYCSTRVEKAVLRYRELKMRRSFAAHF